MGSGGEREGGRGEGEGRGEERGEGGGELFIAIAIINYQ